MSLIPSVGCNSAGGHEHPGCNRENEHGNLKLSLTPRSVLALAPAGGREGSGNKGPRASTAPTLPVYVSARSRRRQVRDTPHTTTAPTTHTYTHTYTHPFPAHNPGTPRRACNHTRSRRPRWRAKPPGSRAGASCAAAAPTLPSPAITPVNPGRSKPLHACLWPLAALVLRLVKPLHGGKT